MIGELDAQNAAFIKAAASNPREAALQGREREADRAAARLG